MRVMGVFAWRPALPVRPPSNVLSVDNAFTGAALDRAGDQRRRDAAWVQAQREEPAARAIVAGDTGLRIVDDALERVPLTELDGAEPLLLGIDADGPLFAVDEDPPRDGRVPMVGSGGMRGEPPEGERANRVPLRIAAARLSQEDGGLAAYTAALLNWHRRHRYCSACGHPSDIAEAGLTRVCPNCGSEHHPRTDPVVIMLVTDGGPADARPPGGVADRPLQRARGLRRARRGAGGGRGARGARGGGRDRGTRRLRLLAAVAVPGEPDAGVQRDLRER